MGLTGDGAAEAKPAAEILHEVSIGLDIPQLRGVARPELATLL